MNTCATFLELNNEATAALGQNTNHMDLYNQFMESAQKNK
jgi:hypothetical protein